MINGVRALGLSNSYVFERKNERQYNNSIFNNYHRKGSLSNKTDARLSPLENYLNKQLRDKLVKDESLEKVMDDDFLKNLEYGYSFEEVNPQTGETSKWTFDKVNNCYVKTVTDIYGAKEKISIPKNKIQSIP